MGKLARATLIGLIGLTGTGAALAGAFQISPVRLSLTAQAPIAVLTVHNAGAEAGVMQLSLMAWSQAEEQDNYLPTQEVLVTPPIFTVAPGGTQIVRVALRRQPDARRELSYRLFLQEVPAATAAEREVKVALRFSVPLFVGPGAQPAAAALDWRVVAAAQGGLRIEAHNRGNAHIQLTGFSLAADGTLLARHKGMDYLLPDQGRHWLLVPETAAPPAARLNIAAQTDAGELHAEAPLEP